MDNATNKDLLAVLDQTIEFMQEALLTKQADDSKVEQLTKDLQALRANQEKVILEKVASARAEFFKQADMMTALGHLNRLGVITEVGITKLASRLTADPNAVFPVMVKLADTLLSAPGEGAGLEPEVAPAEADPDGWSDFVAGRSVRVRR